jgi:thymidylate synthase (FAD)
MHKNQSVYNELVALGIEAEDARFVLPNACETTIEIKMNGRALMNFFAERLCKRAQWEIREVAKLMLKAIKEHDSQCEEYAKLCGPKCERYGKELSFCPEAKSCGRHPRLKEIMEDYHKYQDLCNS